MNSTALTSRKLREYRSTRRFVRVVVLTGIVASIAANVIGAAGPIDVGFAAWPPLALLLAIEILIRVPVTGALATLVRVLGTLGVASAAGYLSYFRMAHTAAQYGEHGNAAYVWPLSVDGLMVVAAVSLVALDGLIRTLEAEAEQAAPSAPAAAPTSPGMPPVHAEPPEVLAYRQAVRGMRSTSALSLLNDGA